MTIHSHDSYSDEDLISFIRGDDQKAFRALYDRYWDKLLFRAIQKLHSSEDACEIVQDVFVNLWKKRGSISIRHSFHTYISAVLKYEILKKITTQGKISTLPILDDATNFVIQDTSTQQQLDFNELQDRLEYSVRKLPEKCQLVFRLSREKGMSEKEIAEALHIAPKTVQGHLTVAIKNLRSSLGCLFFFL